MAQTRPVPVHVSDDAVGSKKMMQVLGELIYTEYQYVQDMKDMIGYLEELRKAEHLDQTERDLIQKYIEMGQVLAQGSVLLDNIPDAKRIYDLIERKFDELGIPPDQRRERIQDALKELAEDKELTKTLYGEVVQAFNSEEVKAYIRSFEPIIATYKAFGEFVEELSKKYPLEPALVWKLSGNESYPIKPTQRLTKYQLHVDQIAGEIPMTPEAKKEFEAFRNDPITPSDREVSAKKSELRAYTIEGGATDQLYHDTRQIIAEVNNEKKSATAQDIRVYFFMKEMVSRFQAWEAEYPEYKDYFQGKYEAIAALKKEYQALQVPTLDQIKQRALLSPEHLLSPNEQLLKEALRKQGEISEKLKDDPENKKYLKVQSEVSAVIGALAKLVSNEATSAQLASLEEIFNKLVTLQDADRPLFSPEEVQAIQVPFDQTRRSLTNDHESAQLMYVTAARDMERTGEKMLGRKERKSFLDTTITSIIKAGTFEEFDVVAHMREMVSRENKQIFDIGSRVSTVLHTPEKDNSIVAQLQILKDGKSQQIEGLVYNKWMQFKTIVPRTGTWSQSYHNALRSHPPFMEKVDKMTKAVEDCIILQSQLKRLEELRNALSVTTGNKNSLLENYRKSSKVKSQLQEYIDQKSQDDAMNIVKRANPDLSEDSKKFKKLLKKETKAQREKIKKSVDKTLADLGDDRQESALFVLIAQQEKELSARLENTKRAIRDMDQELNQIARARVSDPGISSEGKVLDPKEKTDLLFENVKSELNQIKKELETDLNNYKLAKDKKDVKQRDSIIAQIDKIDALLKGMDKIQANDDLGAREKMKQLKNEIIAAKLNDSPKLKDVDKGFQACYNGMKQDFKQQCYAVDKELSRISRQPKFDTKKMDPVDALWAQINSKKGLYHQNVEQLDLRQELVKEKAHATNKDLRTAYATAEKQLGALLHSVKLIKEDEHKYKNESERLNDCLSKINGLLKLQKEGKVTLPRDAVDFLKDIAKTTERAMKTALNEEKKQQKVAEKMAAKQQKIEAKGGVSRSSLWHNPMATRTAPKTAPKQPSDTAKKEEEKVTTSGYRRGSGGGFNS
ncbi:hypothetical protein AQUSIP_22230 [Aquicella siphonis]|uniref:DH domain-containing protein n=1 Tax=Aquicella siphonis TaxID=254247 RepID=A0A5E4PL05_9COXI|nr:RhoGEF domain-containing protein [Aquicella siphonis]VVC76896.1 hypothetical protein AQUSIP_22230 [Aquicella siphonis]